MTRKPYPSDITDDEWAFVAPYLTLMKEDAPQREHDLREVFNAVRWIVRTGSPWRLPPHDLPPWEAVYQQSQRWIAAGVFEAIVHDLGALLRLAKGKKSSLQRLFLMDELCNRCPKIEFADLVTEMKEIKHPYQDKGLPAQAGIEF